MSGIHELSKARIRNSYLFYDALRGNVPKPSLIQSISPHIPGNVLFIGGSLLKKSTTPIAVVLTATQIYFDHIGQYQPYYHTQYYDFYSGTYNSMNRGNFIAVRLQYPTRELISSGVYFESGLPIIIAYQDSAGNWIEMS